MFRKTVVPRAAVFLRSVVCLAALVGSAACGPRLSPNALRSVAVHPATPGADYNDAPASSARPPDPRSTIPPFLGKAIPGARIVSFLASDGTRDVGWVFGDDHKRAEGVLLLHSSDSEMHTWFPYAQQLMKDGFVVLALDFRGYGQSAGSKDPRAYPDDVEGGLDILELFGAAKLVVVGTEVGGTAAVGISPDYASELNGVVVLGSQSKFEDLDVSSRARGLRAKTLVVNAPGQTSDLGKLIPHAKAETMTLGADPGSDANVTAAISSFLDSTIGRP